MIRFAHRSIKINLMGGKYYVEVKHQVFDKDHNDAISDTAYVEVFDTEDATLAFIEAKLPSDE